MAVNGNARTKPLIPQSELKTIKAIIAAIELMLTFDPTMYGVMKFPSRNWIAANNEATPTA